MMKNPGFNENIQPKVTSLMEMNNMFFNAALKKAKNIMSKRPNITDFDIDDHKSYKDSLIEENDNDTKELEDKFEKRNLKESKTKQRLRDVAMIAEAFVVDGIDRYKWLGEGVNANPASLADDFFNKYDITVEIDRTKEELAQKKNPIVFGADITIGSNAMKQKLDELIKEIKELKSNEIPEVFYHIDSEGKKSPAKAPRIVLYIPVDELDKSIPFWCTNNHLKIEKGGERQYMPWQAFVQFEFIQKECRRLGKNILADKYMSIYDEFADTIMLNKNEKEFYMQKIKKDFLQIKTTEQLRIYIDKIVDSLGQYQ